MFIKVILSIVIGYILGSVVAAILISKLFFKEDVREKGSGNSGATNAARVYGLRFGIVTFAFDFAKGILACLIGLAIGGRGCEAAAGIACIIGHCFPILFGFKGGKGVSVGAAFALMADWRVFAIALAIFLIAAFLSKRVSLGSVLATLAVGVFCVIFPPETAFKVLGPIAAAIVIFMHRSNMKRLINGTEAAFTVGKK